MLRIFKVAVFIPSMILWPGVYYSSVPEEVLMKRTNLPSQMCNSFGSDSENLLPWREVPVPLFEGLGNHHYQVHTVSGVAQKYFNQGLILLYGFNHMEAYRSFQRVIVEDALCAMGYWGIAMALGPNLNDPKPDFKREQEAFEAIQKATTLSLESDKEGELIRALAIRHSDSSSVNRDSLNLKYVESMKSIAESYPNDLEIQTLYVDAIMNSMPWDYYDQKNDPKDLSQEATKILERVLSINGDHPGAHHLYIHLVEASKTPDRAIPSAEKLGNLVPNSGHLVHMPAHIFVRVGRHEDAAESNRKAILVDEEYLASYQRQGVYLQGYYPHNIHFLWMAATSMGQSREALKTARKLVTKINWDSEGESINAQEFLAVLPQTLLRFGQWNDILTSPLPSREKHLLRLHWLHAKSIAFIRKNDLDHAQTQIDSMDNIIEERLFTEDSSSDAKKNLYILLLKIPQAELAAQKGDHSLVEKLFQDCIKAEDALPYSEPPTWHMPARLWLGNYLLRNSRYQESLNVFQADLERNRNSGWSLFGMYKSVEGLGRKTEAMEMKKRFGEIWKSSDVILDFPVM